MRKILPFVMINNVLVSQEEACISPLDDGFQYGYGFFTTLKVRERVPLFLEKHIDRLEKSAEKLSMCLVEDCFANARNDVQLVIEKNNLTQGSIRITITKGFADTPTIVIHATTIDTAIHTVPVITVPDERDIYKTIKMTYRVPHMVAMQKAQQQGAQDALFTLDGNLIESTYANLYVLTDTGTIITPPIVGRALDSISRKILMEQLPIQERDISVEANNYSPLPMVLVSSLSIRNVASIDGRVIQQNPDFVSQIQNALETAETRYIAAQKV